MFRRQRQSIQESIGFWKNEMIEGRVQFRRAKKTKEDPWEWQTTTGTKSSSTAIIVQKGDSIRIQQHVHEKVIPVKNGIPILWESDDVVAIDKPGGIPTIDEFGSKGTNSLLSIVEASLYSNCKNHNCRCDDMKVNLQPAHRLDKPVSGVLLIGKTPGKAAALMKEISKKATHKSSRVQKIYVARVQRHPSSVDLVYRYDDTKNNEGGVEENCVSEKGGVATTTPLTQQEESSCDIVGGFPEEITVQAELKWDNRQKRAIVVSSADELSKRIQTKRHCQQGQNQRERRKLKEQVKRKRRCKEHDPRTITERKDQDCRLLSETQMMTEEATTTCRIPTTQFRRLCRMPDGTVLIECTPRSGQRHQIRAHLASIGWPVANDTAYLSFFPPNDRALQKPTTPHHELPPHTRAYVDDKFGTLRSSLCSPQVIREWCPKCQWIQKALKVDDDDNDDDDDTKSNTAMEVNKNHSLVDSSHESLVLIEGGIWLHSWRYVIPKFGLDVTAPLPDWARMDCYSNIDRS